MSLSEIKRKYRQILEEDESACSSEEEQKVDTIYQKMQKVPQQQLQRKQQVISSSANKENSKPIKIVSEDSEKEIIVLREKLASAIEQLGKHAEELRVATQRSNQVEEQKRLAERQLEQVKKDVAEKSKVIAHKETAIIMEQEKAKTIAQELSDARFNIELMKSQEEFYKTEQFKLRATIEEKQQEIRQLRRLKSKAAVHSNENQRLKDDIRRLTTLLAQQSRYKALVKEGGSDFGLSYLGKPHEEVKNWYPRQLIEDTELFLKSQSVGYGNKSFSVELVKYIQAQILSANRRTEASLNKRHESKLKETRRRLNQSLNFHEVQAMSRLKFSRVSNSRTKHLPKFTQPFFQKSVTCNSKATIERSSICLRQPQESSKIATCKELVDEFRHGLMELSEKVPINHKKVGRLCQWLIDSLIQVFKSRKNTLKSSILDV